MKTNYNESYSWYLQHTAEHEKSHEGFNTILSSTSRKQRGLIYPLTK